MGLSRPPLAWITTSAPSPQDSRSPRWAARDRKPVWSRQPETGSRSAGRRRGGCRGGWLRGVCSVFSAWDGVHVVRLAAVRGEDAVSCGWSGRCREGRALRAPRHRPGTRCPARDRCLPGAAGTSQLCAPLPSFGASRPTSFPLAGCDDGPQRTSSLVRRLCLGYYKGGGGGRVPLASGGRRPGMLLQDLHAQPSQQRIIQPQTSVGLSLGNPALGPYSLWGPE